LGGMYASRTKYAKKRGEKRKMHHKGDCFGGWLRKGRDTTGKKNKTK